MDNHSDKQHLLAKIAQLEKDNSNLKKDNSNLEKYNNALSERVRHLADEAHQLDARVHQLTDHARQLSDKSLHLNEQNFHLTERVRYLTERVSKLELMLFGKSSEKTIKETLAEKQPPLNDVELISEQEEKIKRPRKIREEFSAIPDEVKTVDHFVDLEALRQRGIQINHLIDGPVTEFITWEIKKIKIKIINRVHVKMDLSRSDINGNPLIYEPQISQLIDKSMLSPSLMTELVIPKFALGVPLYRMEKLFKQMDFPLTRQLMSQWFMKVHILLAPMMEIMKQDMLAEDIIHADETIVRVLDLKQNGFMWVYCSGKYGKPLALFDYRESREGENVRQFLDNYDGYICSDGYSAYGMLEQVRLVSCLTHIRRGFENIIKVSQVPDSNAKTALNYCNALYREEEKISDLPLTERLMHRQKYSRKIYDDFSEWLKQFEPQLNRKAATALERALKYAIKHLPRLIHIFEDARLEIDNNRVERVIKQFVLGRKAWLFCKTKNGAKVSSDYYSLILTAELNGLQLKDYLEYLFSQLPRCEIAELTKLLPYSKEIVERFRLR